IRALHKKGKIDKNTYIVCNGFKRQRYRQWISELVNDGFVNCMPILDHLGEIEYYKEHIKEKTKVGIRLASDEEPKFEFYTSRLSVSYANVIDLEEQKIKDDLMYELKKLHYLQKTRINDTSYYWIERSRLINKYAEVK